MSNDLEGSGVTLRPAQSDDVAGVESCAHAAYVGYVDAIGKKPAPMVADFGELIEQKHVTVASRAGSIIGFVVMWPKPNSDEPDHFYIDNIAVRPAEQGTGLGRALLAEADRAALAARCSEIRLYTNEAMTENLDYYPRRGFVETHRATDDGFNRVYFSRRVPGVPALEGVLNFREMGGLLGEGGSIRYGAILRSGHLAGATDRDLEKLVGLGVGTIVDFRLSSDRRADGGDDRVPPGATLVELPMKDPSGLSDDIRDTLRAGDPAVMHERFGDGKAHQMAIDGATSQVTDPVKQEVYSAFLRHVAAADRPVLFHCSAGKDRAGWGATVIGMALGVCDDDLVEHYLLSNVHRPPQQRIEYYKSRGVDVSALMPFLGVHEDFIRAALAAVTDQWGGREGYLDALGFGPAELAKLRSTYLVANHV